MPKAKIIGTGHYVPENIVTNEDLARIMDTSDEWIQQRTGIQERRYVDFNKEPMGASDLGAKAAQCALDDAGITKDDVDLIIYGTLSPDKTFPGDGVLVQAKLDIPAGIPALDVRNQCSGFLYGLSAANAFIRSGIYKTILLIGAEIHSTGLDFSDQGRDVAVLFGDGGGAVVIVATDEDDSSEIMSVHLHADGRFANALQIPYPSSAEMPRATPEKIAQGFHWPVMEGRKVFKHASVRMPEAVYEALNAHQKTTNDIDLFIPHQANLRISEMVQQRLGLPDDKVFNNIQKYGNTTACSIPLAIDEAVKAGKLRRGDLLCLAGFGAGFTWGSALIRW